MKVVSQYDEKIVCDSESHDFSLSPVVDGQALTGSELFRRQSAGLPVNAAVRQFDQVNPYLEKFSIYDALDSFRIRHGMLSTESENIDSNQEPMNQTPKEETAPSEGNQ